MMAAAVLLAASCAEAEEEKNVREDQAPGEELVQKTFKCSSEATKSTLGEENKVLFSNGEKILVFDEYYTHEFEVKGSGNQVEITGNVQSGTDKFFALTPYSHDFYFDYDEDFNYIAEMTLPQSQAASKGTFADGINIAAAVSGTDDKFSFKNLLSFAKLTLSSGQLGGKTVKAVELSSSYPLAGDVVVTFGSEIKAAGGDNTVNSVEISKEGGMADGDYYLTLLPNPGGEVTISFTATDGSVATKTATLKEFKAGVIKNLGSVKGLQWKEPGYVLVESAPSDWSGDYVIVYAENSANGTGRLLAGKSSSGNYGAYEDVSISDKRISLADGSPYNVTITKVSGDNYSIEYSATGQFLGWENSSKNYLYFGNSAGNDSYQWNISLSGGYSVITNANTPGRFLEYNASAPRFACYENHQKSVYLYRKDGSEGSGAVEQTTVTTVSASGVTGYHATLNGSFENASASPRYAGFEWGLSEDNLQDVALCTAAPSGTSGSFSATVDNLSDGITYWYRAYIIVWENGKGTYYYGETRSFRVLRLPPLRRRRERTEWKDRQELYRLLQRRAPLPSLGCSSKALHVHRQLRKDRCLQSGREHPRRHPVLQQIHRRRLQQGSHARLRGKDIQQGDQPAGVLLLQHSPATLYRIQYGRRRMEPPGGFHRRTCTFLAEGHPL